MSPSTTVRARLEIEDELYRQYRQPVPVGDDEGVQNPAVTADSTAPSSFDAREPIGARGLISSSPPPSAAIVRAALDRGIFRGSAGVRIAADRASYGGTSGGLRAAEMTKQTLCALKVVPLVGSVALSFAMKLVSDGKLAATDAHEKSASAMLDELHRWASALKAHAHLTCSRRVTAKVFRICISRLAGVNGNATRGDRVWRT